MKFAIFLQNYFPYGGLQRDAVRLAEAAVEAGDQPTLIVSTWNGPKPTSFPIQELNSGGSSNHAKASRFASDCQHILTSAKYDTAICFSRVPGTPFHFCGDPCYLDKFTRTKPSFTRYLPRYRFLINNEKQIFGDNSKTHVFFLAASEIPAYRQHYALPDKQITILPPWLKKPESSPLSQQEIKKAIFNELQIDSAQELLLFVGSDFHRKGLDRAINALALTPSRPHLVVCGQSNPANYQKQSARLGLSDKIHFLGPRDDIPRMMQAASLLIHPARQETAGMVLLESLTYGLPVLCTQQCGYSIHVHEAGCPLLATHTTAHQLAQSITTTLNNLDSLRPKILKWSQNPNIYHTAQEILKFMRNQTAKIT